MMGESYRNKHEQTKMLAIYESNEELEALFHDGFMKKYTNYESFEEFRFAGAVFVNWSADFIVGDRMAFDCCVKGKTAFESWDEMYQTALKESGCLRPTA
ncbi:MAG: hypothetical protein K0R19_3185 [Bacillota bacterium]|nr:hypothetical protein [Bacillota bacterium]